MNLLKYLTSAFVLILLATDATAGVAQAHVLKQSSGISGVLHIAPNDNPSAGTPTKLGISFSDRAGGFSLPDCDCEVSIMQNGKTVQTAIPEPALTGAKLDSYSTVTFPSVGVYEIVATGTSKTSKFPAFQLNYNVRVASGANSAPIKGKSDSGATALIVGIGSFVILVMVAFVGIGQGGRYKTAPKPKK